MSDWEATRQGLGVTVKGRCAEGGDTVESTANT